MTDSIDEYLESLIEDGVIRFENGRLYPTNRTQTEAPQVWRAIMIGISEDLMEMQLDGLVEPSGVDNRGEVTYALTEEGRRQAAEL